MNNKTISTALLIFLSIFLVVISTIFIFSSGGNVIGNSFRYITPLAVLVGLLIPRLAFYLLLLSGAYLDLIKRFMILDSRFTDIDLAFLLGFAPAIVTGLMLRFVSAVVMRSPDISRKDFRLFIITTALCIGLGGVQLMMAGDIRGIGNGINMVAYLYIPLIITRIFKTSADIRTLMIVTTIIYLPAAAWSIKQAHYGLANFELQYLLSGMTIEIRQLDEEVFRNMGTMVSAHALSMVSSILAVALLLPVSWKTGFFSKSVWLNPFRVLSALVFLTGAYYTYSRTGWFCGIVAILAFICLQNKLLTYTAFVSSFLGIIALYLSAQYLLESRTMLETQEVLFQSFGSTAEMRQTMVLGTLDARLSSMASFATDSKLWTPFGLAAAGSNYEVDWVHDILTELLVLIGYIPLAILIIGFIITMLLGFRALYRTPKGPKRTLTIYFGALAIGMMSGGFSQGSMVLYFPINFFWCMFLGIAYAFIQKRIKTPEPSMIAQDSQIDDQTQLSSSERTNLHKKAIP